MKSALISLSLVFTFQVNANAADVLLYNGIGATSGDISALTKVISSSGLSYSTANSSQINSMTRAQFDGYKLIAWPGGDSITMGGALSSVATANIHEAVVLDGISYIGFCAGAFMAETSSIYNTFGLAGTYFGFYAEGAIETLPLSFPAGPDLDVVYWDGPQLSGFGDVVAKYPNGEPAIAEGYVGSKNGFVILSGIHPEAPTSWGVEDYTSSEASADSAYAKTLISAAFHKTLLSHF